MTFLIVFVQTLFDVMLAAFNAAPVMWSAFIVSVVAVTLCAWDGLEQRGLRATCWGICSGAAFGFAMAFA